MGKYSHSHRAAVLSMFTLSRPKHCGEEEEKREHYLSKASCRRKKRFLAKLVTFGLF